MNDNTDILKRAISLINQLKTAGYYASANRLFFKAFHLACLREYFHLLEIEKGEPGSGHGDPYFDLLGIRLEDEYACIPLPLFVEESEGVPYHDSDNLIRFLILNPVRIVPRMIHDRVHVTHDDPASLYLEVKQLIEELQEHIKKIGED